MLGLLVASAFSLQFLIFGKSFTGWEFALWPSSLMFMALDTPDPAATSTVVLTYGIAFAENAVTYAVVGALTWPIVYFRNGRRKSRAFGPGNRI